LVKVELSQGEVIVGEAIEVAESGALLVKTQSGEIKTITAGDVS
jgi:biotin-(acetyl-CoA carboxylase) ligase